METTPLDNPHGLYSDDVANLLSQAVLGMPVTVKRYGERLPSDYYYLVACNEGGNLAPFRENIDIGQGVKRSTVIRLGRWIDGQTAHNHILHATYEDGTLIVDRVIPHLSYVEAQMESISRGGSRIHGKEAPQTEAEESVRV